ncbi:hypothetical protein MMON44395_19875 [Mycolicibacterium monacense DSM 44395]|nr:hypothetical protein [Mycolicibacterium monacense DSM 44395]
MLAQAFLAVRTRHRTHPAGLIALIVNEFRRIFEY